MSIPLSDQFFTTAQVAAALGVSVQAVNKRARKGDWEKGGRKTRGGGLRWLFKSMDLKAREAVAATLRAARPQAEPEPESPEMRRLVAEAVENFKRRTDKARQEAAKKNMLLQDAYDLHLEGISLNRAFDIVARRNNVSAKNLQLWYYGHPAKRGVRGIARENWIFFLVNNYRGRVKRADFDQTALDFLISDYLRREAPSFSSCFRRLVHVSQLQGWTIPGRTTVWRRVSEEYSLPVRLYARTGRIVGYPFQRRDYSQVRAGEIVSADGLKFDDHYVIWPDGEVTHVVGWFQQDFRSGKILAWEVDKTENADLFRRATYKLAEICLPKYLLIDNTRAAANKCMTGQADNRRRFTNKATDPVGFLQLLGIKPWFANPDHEMSSPGVKPIERAFGIGGIHDGIRFHPVFAGGRGRSVGKAIPVAEFVAVLEDVVNEFNARKGRTGGICQGRSYDEVFAEDFARRTGVPKAGPELLALLLKHQEVSRVGRDGAVGIKAGGAARQHCYWGECLSLLIGENVSVLYDPEDLSADVSILDLQGKFLGKARWLPAVAPRDKAAGRELTRERRRYINHLKKTAASAGRIRSLEAMQFGAPVQPGEIPEPANSIFRLAPEEIQKMNRAGQGVTLDKKRQEELMDTVFDNIEKQYTGCCMQ